MRTYQSSARLRPPMLLISPIMSPSAPVNPSTVATAIGKNPMSATITTLGVSPNPNQMISNGASTTIGIVCETIRIG